MKKIAILALSVSVLFASCSKKSSDNTQPTNPNTVTIDGTSYATVKIGAQTWTAVNYNGTGGASINGADPNVYGKLYSLSEAKAIGLPSGWRLPAKADAEKLLLYLGAIQEDASSFDAQQGIGVQGDATVSKKMKSKTDWTYTNGDNSSGFNAYPTGGLSGSTLDGKGQLTDFWTSTAMNGTNDTQYLFGINNTKENGSNTINDMAGMDYAPNASTMKFALRFVKDN